MDDERNTPDPRFLAGENMVLTDTSQMALVVAFDWDGAVDVTSNVDKFDAARLLRQIADHFDPALNDEESDPLRAAVAEAWVALFRIEQEAESMRCADPTDIAVDHVYELARAAREAIDVALRARVPVPEPSEGEK